MTDSAFFGVPGATVEVINGTRAGESIRTDAGGWFTFSGPFDDAARLRATKDGYFEGTTGVEEWPIYGSARWGFLVLAPRASPALTAGAYRVTFAADDACAAIPSGLRTRTYDIHLVPGTDPRYPLSSTFAAVPDDGQFVEGHGSFPVGVAGSTIRFLLAEDGWPYMVERVTPNAYLAFAVDVVGSMAADGSISVRVDYGRVDYCEGGPPTPGQVWFECPPPVVVQATCAFKTLSISRR